MEIQELLDALDCAGLVVTDWELIEETLAEMGLTLRTAVDMASEED